MDFSAISKPPAEADPLPPPSAEPGWRTVTDAARGARRLRLDAAGRIASLADATGQILSFAHDDGGSLRRIASGDWSVSLTGQTSDATFSATDPAGTTAVLIEREGRRRTLTRDGDQLVIELDRQERITRVTLPGSVDRLAYDWDDDGDCVIRAEGGGPMLTLSAAGGARRVALDAAAWWDEAITPRRVTMEAHLAGESADTLDIRLDERSAITQRHWRDGSGDRFERDDQHRLTAWIEVDAAGIETRHAWAFVGEHPASDPAGRRQTDSAGRVLTSQDGGVTYRYDAAGRRVARSGADGTTRYTYDPLGTLAAVSLPDGTTTRATIDGTGRRVGLHRDGAAARIEHRDEVGRLWAVTDADGRPRHVYIWLGDRILARIDGAVGDPIAEAYVSDPFGTPLAMFAAADDGGWCFARLPAPPYGHAADAARPTIYGHFGDPATGLIHFGARDLDPALGVFVTPDPWHGGADDPRRWAGATDAMLAREREWPTLGFHDYALCRFDPLGRCDRDGHFAWGDLILNLFRYGLMATWGFPLTSISLFLFQPVNLYMEIVGLVVWLCKQLCEDKSHPWGNHTIVKSTWLLGSWRQATFAFGLNGFLPRVISGGGINADRAVTVGNVIWINREELAVLRRREVIEVDDIANIAAQAGVRAFNDDPAKRSVVALIGQGGGKKRLHISPWTRGIGNAVRTTRAGKQQFVDRAPGARGTLHLRQPLPDAMPEDAAFEVREFTRPRADPPAELQTTAHQWIALQVPKSTGFARDEWLRISAPDAPAPRPDPAILRIRDVLPATDHAALMLADALPARLQTDATLRIEGLKPRTGGASAGWAADAAGIVLTRTLAPGTAAPADYPPNVSKGGLVQVVAGTKAPAVPPAPGLPPEAQQDTRFAAVTALGVTLTLAPDAGAIAAGAEVRPRRPSGALFNGQVNKAATPNDIKLATPHPAIAADALLIVSAPGVEPFYVRATGAVGGDHLLTFDPPLPARLAVADGVRVSLQATADGGSDKASATAVAGSDVTVTADHALMFAAGNLVRFDAGGKPVLRRVAAVAGVAITLSDPVIGTGPFAITPAEVNAERVRSGVRPAPPGRFLEWVRGAPLASFGTWPDRLVSLTYSLAPGVDRVAQDVALHLIRPATGADPGFAADTHRGWSIAAAGGKQYVVLDRPLPIVRPKGHDGKSYWRVDPDVPSEDDDVELHPLPATLDLRMREFSATGAAVRPVAGGGGVSAHEPEVLVPDDPTIHDTHARALIEHEIHHTVQCNFWGPLMTAFPLQGLVMEVADLVAAGGGEKPDWLDRIDEVQLNPFELFSVGGMMALAWRYVLLDPFRLKSEWADEIDDFDFDSFNKLFNPVSRLITERLPQIDPNAPPGTRWLDLLGRTAANALDLRSWTAFLGFVPTWLPDGDQNFIEQGASRASGDLYSTIVTANDRYNSLTRIRLLGSHVHRKADLSVGIGRPVRLLTFCQYRTHRVLEAASADQPSDTIVYRDLYTRHHPFTMRLTRPGATMLLPADLYEVRRPADIAASARATQIDGAPSSDPAKPTPRRDFVEAAFGDTILPRLRALVPLPPRVNRSLGFYLIAGAPGEIEVAGHRPDAEDAALTVGGAVAAGDTVTLTASSGALRGSPVTLPVFTVAAGQTAEIVADQLAGLIAADPALASMGVRAGHEKSVVNVYLPRAAALTIVWAVATTGGTTVKIDGNKVAAADPLTETATITVGDDVQLDDEPIAWSPPGEVARPAAAGTPIKRFQGERCRLKLRHPADLTGPGFVDAGIDGLALHLSDPAIRHAPLPDRSGWAITMPAAVPAAPARLRLIRTIAKDDRAFDLAFRDVAALKDVRSYLDDDIFVVVRDAPLVVEPLPDLPAAQTPFDTAFELRLPARTAGARGVTVVPPAGAPLPPVQRVGDAGRGEIWRIGRLAAAPAVDTVYKVLVNYGEVNAALTDRQKSFDLTVKASA